MTDLLSELETASDAELIAAVRTGDLSAYGDLFARHVEAAKRLSRQLVRGPDADDLVSDAFAKVLHVLQSGGGPDLAFRAYLLTAVRRLHVDRIRVGAKLQTSDDMTQFDPGVPFQDTAVADFEQGAAAKAFGSLPERWQMVLWHLEVEGQRPADIAPLLGMSANSVAALGYRAREGLRQAFLTMHLSDTAAEECRWVNEHLGAYVRKGLSRRDNTKVRGHLAECRRCTAVYLELVEVNSDLGAIVGPLVLGAAAGGYLATGGSLGSGTLVALLGRARDLVVGNASAATAGAVSVGVAAAAGVGLLVVAQGHQPEVFAEVTAPGPLTTSRSADPSRPPITDVRLRHRERLRPAAHSHGAAPAALGLAVAPPATAPLPLVLPTVAVLPVTIPVGVDTPPPPAPSAPPAAPYGPPSRSGPAPQPGAGSPPVPPVDLPTPPGPAEPVPSPATPTEPAPVESTPTDTPTESAPTDSPTETPTESEPTDTPPESIPTESAPDVPAGTPFSFAAAAEATLVPGGNGQQNAHAYEVRAWLQGLPPEGGTLTLSFNRPEDGFLVSGSAQGEPGRPGGASDTLTWQVPGGSTTVPVSFLAWLPGIDRDQLVATLAGSSVTVAFSQR